MHVKAVCPACAQAPHACTACMCPVLHMCCRTCYVYYDVSRLYTVISVKFWCSMYFGSLR